MGGKGGGQKVYDFLMSVDYGVCHGPVDMITRVRVKEKSILCGQYKGRVDVDVAQDKLFGGDEAEGGVSGVVEIYDGSPDQLASPELAKRIGNGDPLSVPGYRGLCHLFFRGRRGNGFKWATNNPYFPETDVSVVRMPWALSEAMAAAGLVTHAPPLRPDKLAYIYPIKEIDPNGNPVPFSDNMFTKNEYTGTDFGFDDRIGEVIPDDVNTDNNVVVENPVYVGADCFAQVTFRWAGYVDADPLWMPNPRSSIRLAILASYDGGNTFHTVDSDFILHQGAYFDYSVGGTANVGRATHFKLKYDGHENEVQTFSVWGFQTAILDFNVPRPPCAGGSSGAEDPGHCEPDGPDMRRLPNANPAHIIYECMTNRDWGMGESPAQFDLESFKYAAEVFKAEHFGLSMLWNGSMKIREFVSEVLDHVQALLYIDPRTGKWVLKPLREDYDVEAAPILDPTNCKVVRRRRRTWGETANEIVVTYTDPRDETEATVTAHDLGSIAIQGGVSSQSRNYHGVRDPYLAQWLAHRDVRAESYPLFSATVEVDRRRWDITPGSIVRLTWPEDNLTEIVLRVFDVDYGEKSDRAIRLECVEDVFSLDRTTYAEITREDGSWLDTRGVPRPLSAEMAMAAPAALLLREGITPENLDARYPGVAVAFFGWHDAGYVNEVEVHRESVLANGATEIREVVSFTPTPSARLPELLIEEAESTLPGEFVTAVTRGQGTTGALLLIGESEALHEIVMLDTYDANADAWTVWRGLFDTIPMAWAAGTRVWHLLADADEGDPDEQVAGDTITYRFLPRTSEGTLPYNEAADVVYTVTERPYQPTRPANCQLDGNGFGVADYGNTPPASVEATWANRNRTTEDSIATRWTGMNVTGEPGQTTVLRIIAWDGSLVNEITGLEGTSYSIPLAAFGGTLNGWVEFLAERDGLRSRTGARRAFSFGPPGYGLAYGTAYG